MKQFSLKTDTPAIGDTIYVPSYKPDGSAVGYESFEKRGGYGTVARIQTLGPDRHLIFVTEYGGFGMWWEDIAPLQKELAEKYGITLRAMLYKD